MEYRQIDIADLEALWELQTLYKAEIGEDAPDDGAKRRLAAAIRAGKIFFYGAWAEDALIGCCSVTAGFSTFDYQPSGVLEDFFIRAGFRHRGIARRLVQFAYRSSGVSTLTVGCAACDLPMYRALGFSLCLGNLLSFAETDAHT